MASHTHITYRNLLSMKCFNTLSWEGDFVILTELPLGVLCHSEIKELPAKQLHACQFPDLCKTNRQKSFTLSLLFMNTEAPDYKPSLWKIQLKPTSSRSSLSPACGLLCLPQDHLFLAFYIKAKDQLPSASLCSHYALCSLS